MINNKTAGPFYSALLHAMCVNALTSSMTHDQSRSGDGVGDGVDRHPNAPISPQLKSVGRFVHEIGSHRGARGGVDIFQK